jgi:carbamoyl-phosphate synthase small subunit
MPGKIIIDNSKDDKLKFEDPNLIDLAAEVTIKEPVLYKKGDNKILIVDCGVKNNIIQAFLRRNITVQCVPHGYDFFSENFDGVVISNGPGDPKKCTKTIEYAERIMKDGIPVLGICLGTQILALASGADTYKLKYGHRSHNQPVNESGTNRCYITSQNHGYAINGETLPVDWREWFINDNDGRSAVSSRSFSRSG